MSEADDIRPSSRSQRGLDWLNFFIADVQTGFGPFVALYLAGRGWSQGQIIGLAGLGLLYWRLPETRPAEFGRH